MSLHYLIDGYNLIQSKPDYFPDSIRSARRHLVEAIAENRPQGSVRNTITVFFDGQPGVSSPPEKKVKVVYTSGAEADDYIEREVLKSPRPAEMVAVTNDKLLRKKVKAAGGRYMALDEFIPRLFPPHKKKEPFTESGITPSLQNKITGDLKKKWGGDKNDRKE